MLAATFFFTQVAFAHLPQQSLWDARRKPSAPRPRPVELARLFDAKLPSPAKPAVLSAVLSEKLSAVHPTAPSSEDLKDVPLDAVTVRDVSPGTGVGPLAGRRIVIVQDIHMNRESQTNVAKLLFSMMDARRAGLVAVEGAVGAFDLDRFRRFPDIRVTRDVAQGFFDANRMGGPSFAGITTPSAPPPFVGIDDAIRYDENVQAYRAGAEAKPAAQATLAFEERSLATRKRKFPAALAAMDAAATAFDRGEKGLGDHLQLLNSIGALSLLTASQAETAARFLEAWRLEKSLDFSRADAERRTALEHLVEKLADNEMEGIVSLSLAYRKGAVSYGDYHRQISSLFDRHGVSLEKYPAFRNYLRYVALSDGINGEKLLEATRRATDLALARVATTPEQRAVLAESRRHELKRKLVEFSLTPLEWTEYAAGGLTPAMKPFEDFYREAHARSERMVANFTAALTPTDPSKVSVLVIGGFHAPEMAQRLKQLGAGYVLVSPRLTKVDLANGSAYLSIFSREKTPLDRLFEGDRLFLYPAQTDIGASGSYTDGPNREFRVLQLVAQALRSGSKGVVRVQAYGRRYQAVSNESSIPFGYRVVGQEKVGSQLIRLIAPTRWRAGLSGLSASAIGLVRSPARLIASVWDRAAEAGLIRRETAVRFSFLEELLLSGVLLVGLPWALLTLGGMSPSLVDSIRPLLLLASAALTVATHREGWTWTVDGRVVPTGAPALSGAAYFGQAILFRAVFVFPGVDGLLALLIATALHSGWSNGLARAIPGLPVATMSVRALAAPVEIVDRRGTMPGGVVAYNLMDLATRPVDEAAADTGKALTQAEELLPLWAKLGFKRVYLYNAVMPIGDISVQLHQVRTNGFHILESLDGNTFVSVAGYDTKNVEYRSTDGRVVRTIGDTNGNNFSPRDLSVVNPRLIEPHAEATVEAERRAEEQYRRLIRDAREKYGIEIFADFVAWFDPGSVPYEWTFWKPMPEGYGDAWNAAKGDPTAERKVIGRILSDNGDWAVRKVTERGESKLILMRHFKPWGKNVDQLMPNLFNPAVQKHFIDALKNRIDRGEAGVRIDLLANALRRSLVGYLGGSNVTVPTDGPEEPLRYILTEVKKYAASKGVTFKMVGEVYQPDRDMFVYDPAWNTLIDELYYADPFKAFEGSDDDSLKKTAPVDVRALRMALNYMLMEPDRLWAFPSNYDERSLAWFKKDGRYAFMSLLLLMGQFGMRVMFDGRELMFHEGQIISIPGTKHPAATSDEWAARQQKTIAALVEEGPNAQALKKMPLVDAAVPMEWLRTEDDGRYISVGFKTRDGEWAVSVNDFRGPKGQSMYVSAPNGWTREIGLPIGNDVEAAGRAQRNYRLVNAATGEFFPLDLWYDASHRKDFSDPADTSGAYRIRIPKVAFEGPNIWIVRSVSAIDESEGAIVEAPRTTAATTVSGTTSGITANVASRDVSDAITPNWVVENAPSVAGKNIVEVTMEMALTGEAFAAMAAAGFPIDRQAQAAMATSTGGIGPLLKERVIALANLGADVTGVSLLYEHVYVQRIRKQAGQPDQLYQEKVKIGDAFRAILQPAGEIPVEMWDGSRVSAKVWKAPAGMYGKATQYFIDYPPITDVVYPGKADSTGSEFARLSQNWLVGRGTLQLLKQINRKPDVTIMSEMPSTLVHHRLVDDKYTHDPFFKDTMYVFNDHTPLEYAHPLWDEGNRSRMHLRDLFWKNLQVMHGDNVDGTAMVINMMQNVGGVFGVAEKHALVMRAMAALKPFAEKIDFVTNGVSAAYWPSDEFSNPAQALVLNDDDITAVKDRRRADLLRWLGERQGLGQDWAERMIAGGNPIGIWTRRIVEYKRMNVFADLLEDPDMRRQFIDTGIIFIIGGRIHQDDPYGLIQYGRIMKVLSEHPELKDRFIFFDNYNIREAPGLFRGADFSVMLADDGQEASATGFQKAQMNGDAVIASHDGAVPESVVFQQRDAANFNGFEVPYVEVVKGQRMRPTASGLMGGFRLFAQTFRDKQQRAAMIRNAIRSAPRVDVIRTVKDMLRLLERGFRFRQAKAANYDDGREIARILAARTPMSADTAGAALEALNRAGRFSWKYKANGVTETQIFESKEGVASFVSAFRMMDEELGSTGNWSLLFHVSNHNGRGDVVTYLEAAFRSSPELKPLEAALEALADRSRRVMKPEERLPLARAAVGFSEEILRQLALRRDTPTIAPPSTQSTVASRALEKFGILPKAHVPDLNWTAENAPNVVGKRIVEVTMEMALSGEAFEAMRRLGLGIDDQVKAAMATSTGGIGPLLKERVIALGDLGANVVGVSLLYEHVYVQRVIKTPGQPDRLVQDKVEIGDAFRKILEPAGTVAVEMWDGTQVIAKVWKAPAGMYGRSTQYFIDYPAITDVVYPGKADGTGSEFARLSQNWLVGRGTLQLLKQTDQKPDITIMSEMPSTLVFHRLVDDKFTHDPFFDNTHYVFNDHTPLEYAHPLWDAGVRTRMRLRDMFWRNLNVEHDGHVDGTAMMVGASNQVYGVAEKHARVMRAMAALQQFAPKIEYVTNGVSAAYWPTDDLRHVASVETLDDTRLNALKDARRAELIRWLAERQGLGQAWAEKMIAGGNPVGIWTRRIVEYKRMNVFADLLENPLMRQAFLNTGIIFIIGGRIHQDDPYGLIQYGRIMTVLNEHPELKERFVFFDNYNMREAPMLFRGADFSVMLADDGQEASATGFQKEQMNGGAVIASHDGAVPESVVFLQDDPEHFNGFGVPYVEVQKGRRLQPTADGLLKGFELFNGVFRNPATRALMIRNAVKAAPRVDVMRTAKDMLVLLDRGMADRARKSQQEADGRTIGRAAIESARSSIDATVANNALDALLELGDFSFNYKAGGVEERTLIRSTGGLKGFLEAFHVLEQMGTAGDWSLQFHTGNQGGRGDIVAYLESAFSTIPELRPMRDRISALGDRSRVALNPEDRVALARTAVAAAEQAVSELEARAPRREVPLGLLGFWAGLPPMSIGRTSIIESTLIFTALIIAFVSVLAQGSVITGVPTDSLGLLVATARISIGIAFAAFPLLVFAHLVFGVLDPSHRNAVFSGPLAVKAGAVASVTMVGLPLIVFGILALSVQFPIMLIGYFPIILIGVVLGSYAHRAVNKIMLDWISRLERLASRPVTLRAANRDRIISALDPVLEYLGENSATTIDDKVQQLRNRAIPAMPDENVTATPLGTNSDQKVDAIVVLGSHYLSVPARAARIYLALSKNNPEMVVVFAGGMGPRSIVKLPYWSSEASVFRDIFTTNVRVARRQMLARAFEPARSVLGRFAPLLIEVILVVDDALLSYRAMMPRKIFMETQSTNTGANVKNVQDMFEKDGLAPKNIMIVTADVFQRRAVATWIQQYGLPTDRVLSVPSLHQNLKELSNEELIELADEAALQVRRLEEYAQPDKKFTVPVKVPEDIRAATARLRQLLDDASLTGYASGHDYDLVTPKNPFRSFLLLLSGFAVLVGAVGLIPFAPSIGMMSVFLSSFTVLAELLLVAVAVTAVNSVLFSPNGVRLSDSMVPGRLRNLIWIFQQLVPTTIGITLFLLPIMRIIDIPFYVTALALLALGVVVRSWGGVTARIRENSDDITPGAIGLWSGTGQSLRAAGVWEGLAVAAISASAMGLVFALPLLIGDVHAPALAIWAGLTAVGTAVSAGVLNDAHRRFGVTLVPGGVPTRDPLVIASAIRTSYLSLLGIPLLASAFLLPLFPALMAVALGIFLAVVPHAEKNARAERARLLLSAEDRSDAARVARLVSELRNARKNSDSAAAAAALASLVELERLGLDGFGQELSMGAQRETPLTLESDADVASYAAWRFATRSAARGVGEFSAGRLSTVLDATAGQAVSADARRNDSVGVVAAGETLDQITIDVRAAKGVAGERSLIVILTQTQAPFSEALRSEFAGVTFLLERDLSDAADVKTNLLEPVLLRGGNLKMLLQRDAALPDFLMKSLIELGHEDRYRNLVEFVLVAALSNGAFSVRATLGDLQKAMEYRDLVMSQA